MRVGVLIRSYGLTDFLKACIKQYAWVDRIVVMNYRFKHVPERPDNTEQICKELNLPNLFLYKGCDLQMHEVLNTGLAYHKEAATDYVFVSDSDEFITQADQKEILKRLIDQKDGYDCAQISMYDYTKDMKHVYPVRTHKPPTLCQPSRMSFYETRCLQGRGVIYPDIFLHHVGYSFDKDGMEWKYGWEKPVDKWALEIEAQLSSPQELPDEIQSLIKECSNEYVLSDSN